MAKSPKNIPDNYPQPLGMQILKANAFRQASMIRHEIAAELVGILQEPTEAGLRARLVRFIEKNVDTGATATTKARDLWPDAAEAESVIGDLEIKETQKQKHLKLFEQYSRLNDKSLALLEDSFRHIRIILERLHPDPER